MKFFGNDERRKHRLSKVEVFNLEFNLKARNEQMEVFANFISTSIKLLYEWLINNVINIVYQH